MDRSAYRLGSNAGNLVRCLRTIFEYASAALFAILFAAFVLQIGMRFLFNRPLNWPEELSVICYIWIVFLSCAFTLNSKQHVVFNLVTEALSDKGKAVCSLMAGVILGGVFLAVLYGVYDYVAFMKIESSPALMIRKDLIYSVFVVFLTAVIIRCLWTIVVSLAELFSPDTYDTFSAGFAAGLVVSEAPHNEEIPL